MAQRIGATLAQLFSLMLVDTTNCVAASSYEVARVPTSTIVLGSTLEEIIEATERCSIETETACTIEDYSDELSSGTSTVVEEFFIDRYEVSVRRYEQCVRAGACRPREPSISDFDDPDWPVVFVSQRAASDYCRFAGGVLPTEAQFEAAAAGSAGRAFPWGDLFHSRRANFGSRRPPFSDRRDGFELLAPVRALFSGSSPLGIVQLSGNAAEWTSSAFVAHDAVGADTAANRNVVVKGGSFQSIPSDLRAQARRSMAPTDRAMDVGFRCVYSAKSPRCGSKSSC